LYFYGDDASPMAARREPIWREWVRETSPAAGKA